MTKMKKLTAFVLSVAALFTMSGCSLSDTTWAAKYDDTKVNAGVYIAYIVQAYQEAFYMVEDPTVGVLKQTVEGMDSAAWMGAEAEKAFRTFVASEKEFDRLNLTLSEEDWAMIDSLTAEMWAYYGAAYEKAGISMASYRQVLANAYKQNAIFGAYYGPGGEYEVPQEELEEYFSTEFAKVKYLVLEYEDDEDADEDDEDALTKEEALASANGYLEQAKLGISMDEIIDSCNMQQGDEVDTEDALRNVVYLQREADMEDLPLLAKVFEMKYDAPEVLETEDGVYLIQRYDPLEDPEDLELNRTSLLQNLRYEDFEAKLAELEGTLSFTMNDAAVKRYSVKKIVGLVD